MNAIILNHLYTNMALYDYTTYIYKGPKGTCELEEREYKDGTHCYKVGERTFEQKYRGASEREAEAYITLIIGSPNTRRPYYRVNDNDTPYYYYESLEKLLADIDSTK